MSAIKTRIGVAGADLHAPVPQGVRAGRYLFSSMVPGRAPTTREMPSEPERQAEVLFNRLKALVESGGSAADRILNLTIFVMDDAFRGLMERHLEQLFPDASQRPAYQIINVAPRGLGHSQELFEIVVTAEV